MVLVFISVTHLKCIARGLAYVWVNKKTKKSNPFGTALISVGVLACAELKGRDFAKYLDVPQYSVLSPTLVASKLWPLASILHPSTGLEQEDRAAL
jgi:hypothetical protein